MSLVPNLRRVALVDGTEYAVTNTVTDLLAWERYALAHGLDTGEALMHMAVFYAWRGARKQGLCDQDTTLDAWAERIDTFDLGDDPDETPDPTLPAPGAG